MEAILAPDGAVLRTFAGIEGEAEEWAARIREWTGDCAPGTVIGMQLGNSPAWPALILGAMRAGVIPLPLGRHMAREEREAAMEACGAGGLIENADCRQPGVEWTLRGRGGRPPGLAGCDFLKLTSGTTSRPRAIRFTAAQLVADCDNICETMGIRPEDLNYAVIPYSHSYGFSNLITPLICHGVRMVVTGDSMPRAILSGLAETGATVFAGMPVFFEKLAGLDGPPVPALPALRLCISAGAPLPARVGEAFTGRYGVKVHTFYGSSECGGIAYDGDNRALYEEGFVGKAMRNVTIAVQDGRIAVRSAAVGDGYFPVPEPEVLDAGRFVPADLATEGERGLILAGRATDVINIAGRKLNPGEVEARLALCPGVRQVVVFGVASALRNEEAVACVCGEAAAEEVMRYARANLSAWQVPKSIWRVGEVPVNDRGKISRRELARLWEDARER